MTDTDIVERLRTAASNNRIQAERGTTATGEILTALGCQTKEAVASMHDESVDEIERLRSQLKDMAEALEPFANEARDDMPDWNSLRFENKDCKRARAALKKAGIQ